MKTCTIDGCDRIHRAKGLCSTHYNQQMPAEKRHPKVAMRCAWCDVEVEKDGGRDRKYAFVVCGYKCRTDLMKALKAGCYAPHQRPRLRKPTRSPLPDDHWARWYGASSTIEYSTCEECGRTVASPIGRPRRFCYKSQCHRRRNQRRRRARERDAVSDGYTRIEIFERDNWTCWICGDPVTRDAHHQDYDAPTVDHKIALAAGGNDTRDNVATAHRWCNSVKRELPIGDVA
jgi:hypothetical protein